MLRTLVAGLAGISCVFAAGEDCPACASFTQDIPLQSITFSNGTISKTITLTVGLGSGAFHRRGDNPHTVYTITDRGPNIDIGDAVKIIGFNPAAPATAGKIFPIPGFAPTIFKLRVGNDGFTVLDTIPLRNRSGDPITGLPNPGTENAFNAAGAPLPLDPEGLDTEGLVRLGDGSFWTCDEYSPSLVHVGAKGRVRRRLVPAGIEAQLVGADYPVDGVLPAIYSKRRLNRGFEGIAVSPDNRFLFTCVQSPLDHPAGTSKTSRVIRLLKVDAERRQPVGEFVFLHDSHETFAFGDVPKAGDVKISELVALDRNTLLVLERTDRMAKLYRIDLPAGAGILGSAFDNVATSPTLEQLDLTAIGAPVIPLTKTLLFDQRTDCPTLVGKIESVAQLGGGHFLLINDNDFAIDGAITQFTRIFLVPSNSN